MATTIIVEDGSLVANANSFNSTTDIDEYFSCRGITDWAPLTGDQKNQANILAMDVLINEFGPWQGNLVECTQSLFYPRENVEIDGCDIAKTTIPSQLKNAHAELARHIAVTNRGISDTATASTPSVIESARVDVLSVTFDASSASINQSQTVRSYVRSVLAPFLSTSEICWGY